ncbi:hypothetical protein Trydic_g22254 [Trypoxylus dichotomus]
MLTRTQTPVLVFVSARASHKSNKAVAKSTNPTKRYFLLNEPNDSQRLCADSLDVPLLVRTRESFRRVRTTTHPSRPVAKQCFERIFLEDYVDDGVVITAVPSVISPVLSLSRM